MASPQLVNLSTVITATTAIFRGQIISDKPVLTCGVVAVSTANDSGAKSVTATPAENLTLEVTVTGLEPGKQYFFDVYVTNKDGTAHATYTLTTSGMSAPLATGFWACLCRGVGGYFRSLGAMTTIVFIAELALIAIVTAYMFNTRYSESNDFARGLITVLFSTGTIAIAFILTIMAIFSEAGDANKERFERGKQIFTVMIGIFGTIMGFYFGSTQVTTPADKFSIVGSGSETLKPGESKVIKLNLIPAGAKATGTVKLGVESLPVGLKVNFSPEQLGSGSGEVSLTVTAEPDADAKTHVLRVIAIPENTAISAAELKITIVVTKK